MLCYTNVFLFYVHAVFFSAHYIEDEKTISADGNGKLYTVKSTDKLICSIFVWILIFILFISVM